jgi:hypothetical protein
MYIMKTEYIHRLFTANGKQKVPFLCRQRKQMEHEKRCCLFIFCLLQTEANGKRKTPFDCRKRKQMETELGRKLKTDGCFPLPANSKR